MKLKNQRTKKKRKSKKVGNEEENGEKRKKGDVTSNKWPQFCHIDADFKNSKRDLELALYVFTYLSRAHRLLIKCRFPES